MTLGLRRERPTTVLAPRDVSVVPDRASAAAGGVRVSEAELWWAYATAAPRVEPCLCGGLIVADAGDPTSAVRIHNATLRHTAWATEEGWR